MAHEMERNAELGGYTCKHCGQTVTFALIQHYRKPLEGEARDKAATILQEVTGDCRGSAD